MTEIIFQNCVNKCSQTFFIGCTACYNHSTDTITVDPTEILTSDKLNDDEKLKMLSWQMEHEYIHAVLDKYVDSNTSVLYDNIGYMTLNDEILNIAKKLGWKYTVNGVVYDGKK